MVRPTAPGGFVFQWFAQRVCGVGVGFGFNGPPNGPGRGFGFFLSMVRPTGLRGRGRFFSMVRPTGLRGRGRFFSMVRPTGLRGRGRFFSMVRPTGPGGVSDFLFQWSAQRAREGFRFSMVRPTGLRGRGRFFSMVRPTSPGGVSDFFNGPPNGPGRGFVFQWSAQRAREGFRFSMVRPTGLRGRGRFFSMVRPTGLRGRGRFFSMVRPTGPGGVSDFFFQWSAQRAREEFRIFFSMVRPTGPGGVSFFNGSPNGSGGVSDFFLSTGLPNVSGGFRFSMVCPTRLVCRGPQTLKGHLHGFGPCHYSSVYIDIGTGVIVRFARFCATKCYYYRPYMYVHPGVIAFLHGFARFAHASPRSFDWFAQPVGFPSTPNPNPKRA